MDILAKLFGSESRVKILRLFLFNQENVYSLDDITTRSKVKTAEVKKELSTLVSIGLIKQKPFVRDVEIKKKKKIITKKIKGNGYILDTRFMYLTALKNLLITVSLNSDDDIARRFSKVGKIKLLIAAGVFIQDWNSRVDLLIVGDELNTNRIQNNIEHLEAELGKQVSYSVLSTEEFEYRVGVYDKLIRDILDFPHTTIIDRLGVSQ
ncbi:MAG: hypothetical protein HZA80_01345 [Candidatus Taylorbacteria bacterium]|nr:hypothetical protein [Candidatus Taylorbacteria bacterium]